MHLKFTWPRMADSPLRENFFFGGWHPSGTMTLEWKDPPATIQPAAIRSDNWFLISNVSLLHTHKPGLIHLNQEVAENSLSAVAFLGYLLDPPIHSYSLSTEIVQYWQSPYAAEYNGVFSAACIRDSGQTLELINDAFGMSPLYYRQFSKLILFATNPKFLTSFYDEPDYIAWRSLIQASFIIADRALLSSIKRVPAGHVLRFQRNQIERYRWFDYETIPDGTQKITDKAIANVEEAFQDALSRCLQLKTKGIFLPLSSGYDSRRILAGLMHRKIPFEAATVRILEKENRDLDIRCTSLMAKDLGFTHRNVEYQYPLDSWEYAQKYAYDDYQRRIMLDAENQNHTWAVPLMRSLPDYPTLLFDGLAGDALGNSGFGFAIPGLYESPESDKRLIAQHAIGTEFDDLLHSGVWPSAEDIRNEFRNYFELLPHGFNQIELVFLLLRTRRTIAIWAQHMVPAGHVIVCPYLDLHYVRTTLVYHPAEKEIKKFTKLCLEKHWPQYFAYPGSRAVPSDIPPGPTGIRDKRELACFRQLQKEVLEQGGMSELKKLLSTKANLRFWFAQRSDRMAVRMLWAFWQLMELVAHHTGRIACWEVFPEE